ncbi:Unknown protein [Striga hermonthica]|uniref:Uncharacterized protein n=1 Tax=Striga hermonthica TaxID=68872 RepID=A0A9N7MJG3_STRHE|nr:Unknown protein [Striga hermonthica]
MSVNQPQKSSCGNSVQLVSKSLSEKLLEKYFDALEFDFDYNESALWSPLVPRRAFLVVAPLSNRSKKMRSLRKLTSWFGGLMACFKVVNI